MRVHDNIVVASISEGIWSEVIAIDILRKEKYFLRIIGLVSGVPFAEPVLFLAV